MTSHHLSTFAATSTPSVDAITSFPSFNPLRSAITRAWRLPEPDAIPTLLEQLDFSDEFKDRVQALARRLTQTLRATQDEQSKNKYVQGLLREFSLSSNEGIALMCLAEALLRIPDNATRDRLIRDKISRGQWQEHLGHSPSMFVNAAAWGLMLTGKLVATHSEEGLINSLGRLLARGGEPLVRKGIEMAMRMMGQQFVTGETMSQALTHAQAFEAKGFRYSYDMLGEAALTHEDAERYLLSYEQAIHAIGRASNGRGVYEGPGISIKLSALHPRYTRSHIERVNQELYPTVLRLARLAKDYNIGLNIDAEETDRLELSLDLIEKLCHEPELIGWQGIGFVVQAYQKRCPYVIDYLIDLAKRTHHRLMIRLVKGAYWDSEIKRTQEAGLADFPVYTRKVYTDVSYLACARKLLEAPAQVYPQFATHNAQTLAMIYEMADPASYHPEQYEFQCLHGMGEPLYELVVGTHQAGKLNRPCRIYAPVGTHETLLAYLVRRLLENGANTSFINQLSESSITIDALVKHPVDLVHEMAANEGRIGLSHPNIRHPRRLYGNDRDNAWGMDLANDEVLIQLQHTTQSVRDTSFQVVPLIAEPLMSHHSEQAVYNPACLEDRLGTVVEASDEQIHAALYHAHAYAQTWARVASSDRANMLQIAATRLEEQSAVFMTLLVREAGKTYANALAEVREAVDFLRYYAGLVGTRFDNETHVPLGAVVCISPWNFPLAIFVGQVAAALASGNTVLAKPAEQTPIIAYQTVQLLYEAGVPRHALQLLPGRGERVGAQLVQDERTQGVLFTGSTAVARILQQTLAQRLSPGGSPIPLIAETGGQNAMIVDSSALTEQVVSDVLLSAFDSAGQRCSALRVLCVQEEALPTLRRMLKGAMQTLTLGDPNYLHTDIGPVIDADAQTTIVQHIERCQAQVCAIYRTPFPEEWMHRGTFVAPTLIEIHDLNDLQNEVFGPVLHLLTYQRTALPNLLTQLKQLGYGLTMGLHTRIDETIDLVTRSACVGNLYVNRNMVGAVVGVQPFGGEGLSGTGPKAGGPLYLYRLLRRRPTHALATPYGVIEAPGSTPQPRSALATLIAWSQRTQQAIQLSDEVFNERSYVLPGPTGERNTYRVLGRQAIVCVADQSQALLNQLTAVLQVGSHAVWLANDATAMALYAQLPTEVQGCITRIPALSGAVFDAVIYAGQKDGLKRLLTELAQRPGAIIPVIVPNEEGGFALERLLLERVVSINTTAAGGNASLMTMPSV